MVLAATQNGLMAGSEDRQDIDALLAEVNRTLGGGSAAAPPARRDTADGPGVRRGLAGRTRNAAVAGGIAAGGVWVLFALMPFLRATSGAVGAFIGVFVVALLLGRRRR
jgi:hypothetical protein